VATADGALNTNSAGGRLVATILAALAEWESKLPDLFKEEGPLFVDLKVEPGETYPEDFPKLSSTEHREKFRGALANG